MTADDQLAAENAPAKPGPEADGLHAAERYLQEALKDGPQLTREIERDAREGYGISPATLRRARDALKVQAFRLTIPGPWYLRLPGGDQAAQESAPVAKGEHLEHLESLAENTEKSEIFDPADDNMLKLPDLESLDAVKKASPHTNRVQVTI
jgi:hypothetical protein